MTKRKKHRLVIEVTTSTPLTEAEAVKGLQLVLDSRLDLQANPIWAHDRSPYVDKLTVKAFSRVLPKIAAPHAEMADRQPKAPKFDFPCRHGHWNMRFCTTDGINFVLMRLEIAGKAYASDTPEWDCAREWAKADMQDRRGWIRKTYCEAMECS